MRCECWRSQQFYWGNNVISSNKWNVPQNNLYIINFFHMIQSSLHLFEEIHAGMFQLVQELDKSRLRNNFVVNKTEIQLALTDNYVVLFENIALRTPTHFCRLTFDVKFQVIYQQTANEEPLGVPCAIKLERENCTEQLTFTANSPSILQTWGLELQKKINQRNFHKLFKAKRKVGKGAFATVYLAERLRDHKMVAVKAFSKQKQYASDKGKESLQNQIKVMRRVNHSNIMKLEGVYQTQNSIYVILQYLQGAQLNQFLKTTKNLQKDQIRAVIQNILRGLSHLAKNRIIHRDLKPDNIMFRKQNSYDLAICDFGLATYAEEEKYLFVRCGTPGFVAPQIINIRDMSTKSEPISDVFSAGIIFHHLLFGSSIFQGKKYNDILNQNRACDFNFAREPYTGLNNKTLDLLTRMLQKDPSKRISAENALNHAYFTGEMEVEKEQKAVFRQLTILAPKIKDIEPLFSPSTAYKKKEDKKVLFDPARKEGLKTYYS